MNNKISGKHRLCERCIRQGALSYGGLMVSKGVPLALDLASAHSRGPDQGLGLLLLSLPLPGGGRPPISPRLQMAPEAADQGCVLQACRVRKNISSSNAPWPFSPWPCTEAVRISNGGREQFLIVLELDGVSRLKMVP